MSEDGSSVHGLTQFKSLLVACFKYFSIIRIIPTGTTGTFAMKLQIQYRHEVLKKSLLLTLNALLILASSKHDLD